MLLVSDFYPPIVGGMERIVEDLATELAARGHEVSVATLASDGHSSRLVQRGVTVHRLASLSARLLKRFYDNGERRFHPTIPDPLVTRDLRRLIRSGTPDIVHANGWIMHSCVPAVHGTASKLIVTLHDYGLACPKKTYLRDHAVCDGPGFTKCITCAADQYGTGKAVALTVGIEASARTLYGAADRYIAISEFVAEVNRQRLPRESAVDVVPSFVADDIATVSETSERPAFLPPSDGYLMYAGSLDHHKGVDVLLAAYRQLNTATPLVMLGPNRGAARMLPPGARTVHDVPHDQVLGAWRGCSVAVVPSLWAEPFGLVAVEAMACARPVVAADLGGLRDIVDHERTGLLIPPGDVNALTAALRNLLADTDKQTAYGLAGLLRARRFGASTVIPQIEAVYRNALASSPPC